MRLVAAMNAIKQKYCHLKGIYPKSVSVYLGATCYKTSFEGASRIGKGSTLTNSEIGYGSYVGKNSEIIMARIGRYCSIGSHVSMPTGQHPKHFVSTAPCFFSTAKQNGITYVAETKYEEINLRHNPFSRIVGNDVWIGNNAIILEGVSIGDGAIVGAGAIVTRDVEPYSIVAGVPARVVGHRFDDATIAKLLKLQWWNKSSDWIRAHASLFDDVEKFIDSSFDRRDY